MLYRLSYEPILVLIALLTSTAWILTMLLISFINQAIPLGLVFLVVQALVQELIRLGIYFVVRGLPFSSHLKRAVACGLGIGVAATILQVINPLVFSISSPLQFDIFVIGLFGFLINMELTFIVFMKPILVVFNMLIHIAFSLLVKNM
jgi:hypothetical protein